MYSVSVNPVGGIQTLRYNSAGPEVKKIQERLVSAGFLENRQVDGIFGRQTEIALREFQGYQGLPQDGILAFVKLMKPLKGKYHYLKALNKVQYQKIQYQ